MGDKDHGELDTLLVSQLKEICKTYNHPVTGKRKHELIEMIMGGRSEDNLHPTEMEKVLKKALLSPLRDKDRSAWKLGLLNEAKVVSVIKAVVKGVGYELVHCWSVGLLRNKDNPFAATSLVIVSFIHGRRKQSATLGMYLKAVETHLTSLTKIPLLIESEKTAGWSIFHSQKQTSVAPAVRRRSH